MARLVIGTDNYTDVPVSRGLRPRPFEVQPARTPDKVYDGLRHAVPEDDSVALCGYVPEHVWDHQWPGGYGGGSDLCPDCRALVQDTVG